MGAGHESKEVASVVVKVVVQYYRLPVADFDLGDVTRYDVCTILSFNSKAITTPPPQPH